MVTPETLHIVLWRGERIQIRRDGQLVYEGRSFAATLRALSSFLGVVITAKFERHRHADAASKKSNAANKERTKVAGNIGEFVGGFFGRLIYIPPRFIPPPPDPSPEERFTSMYDRARIKLVRGIPITEEEADALRASEHSALEK